MARILIGWELGGNRGHIVRILHYHDALVAAGHQVSIALQRVDGLAGEQRTIPGAVWQAPLWPRLLANLGAAPSASPATLGDILARMGLADPGTLAALIGGWDRLIAAERPDLVVADYAPALLSTARGRLPTISVGYGFCVPPGAMPAFPSLSGAAPAYDEARLLERANGELAAAGRTPLAALPELFAADREIAGILAPLDPYAAWRTAPVCAPATDGPLPAVADGGGDELFVYWPEQRHFSQALWEGLMHAGVPVRLYSPGLNAAQLADAETHGFATERRRVGFDRIVARARMVLSHGGGGFVTMAALVGLPQVILHYDLEKRGTGLAVERLGVGAQTSLIGLDAGQVTACIRHAWDDPALGARARAAAADLRTDMGAAAVDEAVAAASRLLN